MPPSRQPRGSKRRGPIAHKWSHSLVLGALTSQEVGDRLRRARQAPTPAAWTLTSTSGSGPAPSRRDPHPDAPASGTNPTVPGSRPLRTLPECHPWTSALRVRPIPLISSLTLTVPAVNTKPSRLSLASPRPQNAFPARQPRPRPPAHARSLLPAPGSRRSRPWSSLSRTRNPFRPTLGASGPALGPKPCG